MSKKKKKCSFRLPVAETVDGVPYLDRWVIYCDCGCTIFGNSIAEAQSTWYAHVEGKL